jgi:hypothetical protein
MSATTDPPAKPPAVKPPATKPPANPAAGRGAAAKPPAAQGEDKTTDYLVFEATEVDEDGLPTKLERVAEVTAENPKVARWSAADANTELLARTKPDGEGAAPLLLPIARRLAEPTATREEEVKTTKRV